MRKVFATLLFVAALAPLPAMADDTLARFDGGIGVIPVSSGVAIVVDKVVQPTSDVVNRNVVRGVQPAGQIWVISDLKADVKFDGTIHVVGRGLLLGGGDNVGTNANAKVFATLICKAADGTFTLHSTDSNDATTDVIDGVPLAPNGDFRIDDLLSPAPPNPCVSPVLLIRNAANLSWFAAGIPKL
jgi:hypothetical protein